MAGTGGFNPITIPLAGVRSGLESLFANQSTLAARIVSAQDGALFALVSALRVPVPKDSGLKNGDAVILTLTREGGEVRLSIKPAPAATQALAQQPQPGRASGSASQQTSAQPGQSPHSYGPTGAKTVVQPPANPPTSAPPAIPQSAINQAAPAQPPAGQPNIPQASPQGPAPPTTGQTSIPPPESLAQQSATRAAAAPPPLPIHAVAAFVARALPQGVSTGSPVAQLLLSLFTGGERLSDLVGVLRSLAGKENAEPARLPASVPSEDSAKAAESIRKWVRVQRSAPEAKLASLTNAEAPLDESEVVELAKLRRTLFGKATGLEREGRAENVFERVTASRVWNLNGLEQPYLFAELPVTPESFWRRAQIHVFGEGDNQRFDGPVSVVLDLDTEALGPMWATVRTDGRGACSCVVRAAETHANDLLESASPDLEEALQRAGYSSAKVRVEPWQEDRLDALEAMTARLSGLDAEA